VNPARVRIAGAKPTAVSLTWKSLNAVGDRSSRTSRCTSSRDRGPAIDTPQSVEAAERTHTSAGGAASQNQRK